LPGNPFAKYIIGPGVLASSIPEIDGRLQFIGAESQDS
jgi:hypothetical protein